MAVAIRLTRRGSTKRPFYRIVVATKDRPRDGRFIEVIGWFNPRAKVDATGKEQSLSLKEDRVKFWIERGATATLVVENLIKKQIPGLIEQRRKHQQEKVLSARRRRKERRAASGATQKAAAAKKTRASKKDSGEKKVAKSAKKPAKA